MEDVATLLSEKVVTFAFTIVRSTTRPPLEERWIRNPASLFEWSAQDKLMREPDTPMPVKFVGAAGIGVEVGLAVGVGVGVGLGVGVGVDEETGVGVGVAPALLPTRIVFATEGTPFPFKTKSR